DSKMMASLLEGGPILRGGCHDEKMDARARNVDRWNPLLDGLSGTGRDNRKSTRIATQATGQPEALRQVQGARLRDDRLSLLRARQGDAPRLSPPAGAVPAEAGGRTAHGNRRSAECRHAARRS